MNKFDLGHFFFSKKMFISPFFLFIKVNKICVYNITAFVYHIFLLERNKKLQIFYQKFFHLNEMKGLPLDHNNS